MVIELRGQQQDAYNAILTHLAFKFNDPNKFFVLTGWAGTGKTFLLKALNNHLGRFGSVFTAPTNKATKVTRGTIGKGAECKTIYSLLGVKMVSDEDQLVLEFPKVPVDLSGYDRIFVDEASMLNSDMVDYIIERSQYYRCKWIFIGDKGQIPPVGEKTSKVWSLKCPSAHLDEVVRYDNQILNLATYIRRKIQKFKAKRPPEIILKSDHDAEEGVWKYGRRGFMRNIERAAKKGLFTEVDHTKAIAWRNSTVNKLNEFIRYNIFGDEADSKPYIIGDRIMIAEPVIMNGATLGHIDDEGTIIELTTTYHSVYKELNSYNATVQIDDGLAVTLNIIHPDSERRLMSMLNALAADAKIDRTKWKNFWALRNSFHKVRYSYAMTSHRVQGSTFVNAFVDTADILANYDMFEALRCLYVAFTRPTTTLILT